MRKFSWGRFYTSLLKLHKDSFCTLRSLKTGPKLYRFISEWSFEPLDTWGSKYSVPYVLYEPVFKGHTCIFTRTSALYQIKICFSTAPFLSSFFLLQYTICLYYKKNIYLKTLYFRYIAIHVRYSNTNGIKHSMSCCYRKIIHDGVVSWSGVTVTAVQLLMFIFL